MSTLHPQRVIAAKRAGAEHAPDELQAWMDGYLAGDVADEQMSAWMMAGVINGFTTAEAVALTDIFVRSGDVVDLSGLDGVTVDKHSTGGVADTTTFVVAPLAAACGLTVAKLSGRGLGHTGGTLDKLEAIEGVNVSQSLKRVQAIAAEVGCVVAAATGDLVPLDKKLYALRDVTGTVESMALIASSVMSKKLAGGAQTIVLDVKVGDGAFLSTTQDATKLAELCIQIGEAHGRKVHVLVTDMDQPLGPAVGNALEVAAALDVLERSARGPLRELSIALVGQLLVASDSESSVEAGRKRAESALDSGEALNRFASMIAALGGPDTPAGIRATLPTAAHEHDVTATTGGTIQSIAARELGLAAGKLGAGRLSPGDTIDMGVGLTLGPRVGDRIGAGDRLATIHARSQEDAAEVAEAVLAAFAIGEEPRTAPPLIRTTLPQSA